MLAELRSWIAGLITLIFFATILEMLLPTSSMRRFVRLVIGLVLIMVLMKPVFSVLKLTLAPERVLWSLQQNIIQDSAVPAASGVKPQFDDLVIATARDRVCQQVEQTALQIEGIRQAKATVSFDDHEGDTIQLKEVEVTIVPGPKSAVSIVETVEVQLRAGQSEELSTKKVTEWSPQEQNLARRVQSSIASVFGIDQSLVRVHIRASY